MSDYVHPEPVDLGIPDGTRVWIYRDSYLHPATTRLGEILNGQYRAYTARYPGGDCLAAGMTVAATIRRARRRALAQAAAAGPVDVRPWVRPAKDDKPYWRIPS